VTRRAALIFKPTPPYTEAARRKGITGIVVLRTVLNSNGKVTNVAPLLRLPHGLTETAVRAARGIKFLPAEKDGRRVSQYATIQFNFNIY
jgi:TonB family protein